MKFMKFSFLALLLVLGFVPAQAQEDIVVTVTAPSWMGYFLDSPQVKEGFAEANPGYQMVFVDMLQDPFQGLYSGELTEDTQREFLDGMAEYANAADVLYFESYTFRPSIVEAGYLLNLDPLIITDPDLDVNDYFQAAWESYRWAGGQWGLPATASPRFLVYNAARFDALGLTYPAPSWTIDNYASAMRSLAEFNAAGELVLPGMMAFGADGYLLRSLLGQPFHDAATNEPALDNPQLADLLNTWIALEDEQVLNIPEFQGLYEEVPMRVEGIWALRDDRQQFLPPGAGPIDLRPALLPGGTAIVESNLFAVSAGTNQPEAAYRLAKYLADNFAEQYGMGEPARRSQIDSLPFSPYQGISPESRAFVEQALDNGIPYAELRYQEYIQAALQTMREEDVDAQTALAEIQSQAMTMVATARERAQTTVLDVAPPPAPPQLAEGEVALNFGLALFGPNLPNADAWERAIDEFVANDPTVGHIELDTRFSAGNPESDAEVDCYFENYNRTFDEQFRQSVLTLDPFMDADPNFDPDDFIAETLAETQFEGRTYGYPLTMEPMMLGYEPEIFNAAGVVPPADNLWTVEQFTEALRMLDVVTSDEAAPFQIGGGGLELLMVVAAYGGLPYDITTNPPTLNFDDPQNIAALQQVLNLARDGLIMYFPATPREGMNFGGGGSQSEDGLYTRPAMYINYGASFFFRPPPDATAPDVYPFTSFPRGERFTPVSYNVGPAYIDARTRHPEACYRWISHLANNPDLLLGMPTRRSALDNSRLEASAGPDVVAFYRDMLNTLEAPNALAFSFERLSAGPADFVAQQWFYGVLDDYVFEENPIDLEARLAEAEQQITAFRECTSDLPPFEPPGPRLSPEEGEAYIREYLGNVDNCAMAVDPDYQSPFGLPPNG